MAKDPRLWRSPSSACLLSLRGPRAVCSDQRAFVLFFAVVSISGAPFLCGVFLNALSMGITLVYDSM